MKISAGLLGFLRGLGVLLLTAALGYVGDVSHLSWLGLPWSAIIASGALAIEHWVEGGTGNALFGMVKRG